MKQRMQGAVMGALTMVLLLGAVTVYAASTRSITVEYGGIRTTINGQEFVVRNNAGLVMESFIYNGEVYLPLASVLHAMGGSVQWDRDSRTVDFAGIINADVSVAHAQWGHFDEWGFVWFELDNDQQISAVFNLNTGTDGTGQISGSEYELVEYEDFTFINREIHEFTITGPGHGVALAQPPAVQPTPPQRQGVGFFTTYDHFQEQSVGNARPQLGTAQSLGVHYPNSLMSTRMGLLGGIVWRDYNINAQRTRLTGYVIRRDGGGTAASSITFFGDGRELLTVTTNENDQPHPVNINLTGVRILRIQVYCNRSAFTSAVIY